MTHATVVRAQQKVNVRWCRLRAQTSVREPVDAVLHGQEGLLTLCQGGAKRADWRGSADELLAAGAWKGWVKRVESDAKVLAWFAHGGRPVAVVRGRPDASETLAV